MTTPTSYGKVKKSKSPRRATPTPRSRRGTPIGESRPSRIRRGSPYAIPLSPFTLAPLRSLSNENENVFIDEKDSPDIPSKPASRSPFTALDELRAFRLQEFEPFDINEVLGSIDPSLLFLSDKDKPERDIIFNNLPDTEKQKYKDMERLLMTSNSSSDPSILLDDALRQNDYI